MKSFKRRGGLAIVMLLTSAATAPKAIDVQGNARVYRGRTTTENGVNSEQDYLNQLYHLSLTQNFGPWLGFELGYMYTDFDTSFDAASLNPSFYRNTSTPSLRIFYNRPNISGFLQYTDRQHRSSTPAQNLDIEAFLANFTWRPYRGPEYQVQLRQDVNQAVEVATFGRDIRTRFASAGILYERPTWSTAFRSEILDLENQATGLQLDQKRHEFRGLYNNRYWQDRVSINGSARLSRATQEQNVPAGSTIGEPIPVVEGLYLLDTTPDLDALGIAPDISDGDTTTPARTGNLPGDPIVEIGGANTDRNLGVDLGFIRDLTRIQVYVDAISGPNVLWAVYTSTNNQNWTQVTGVTSFFEQPFLRYDIRFPLTTNRYFKVVNLTSNSQANVAVTELSAILDRAVTGTNPGDRDSDLYQLSFGCSIAPAERFTAYFDMYYNQRQSALGGLVGRKTVDWAYDTRFVVNTSRHSLMNFRYRLTDFEQSAAPQLYNTENFYSASYIWTPPRNVATEILASSRVQTDRGTLLRSTKTLRGEVTADLLPSVRAVGFASYNVNDDPFAGFEQTNYRYGASLEGQVSQTARVIGSVSDQHFDFTGVVPLTRRVLANVAATWQVNPFVVLTGRVGVKRDTRSTTGLEHTVSQRYTLTWNPGLRLVTGVHYQSNDDNEGGDVTAAGANISYKINPRFTIFGTASRTRTTTGLLPQRQVVNVLAGLYFNF